MILQINMLNLPRKKKNVNVQIMLKSITKTIQSLGLNFRKNTM